MDADRQQRLEIHRELQLLRAAAWRPKKGYARQKRSWVKDRIRKLDQAQRQRERR